MRREYTPVKSPTSFSYRGGVWKGLTSRTLSSSSAFGFNPAAASFFCVSLRQFGEDKCPFHQESSGEHFSTGVFSPRTIDSRILGIESRYNVSWIARQSSTETKTPAFFFPTMWIGSWDFSDSARSFEILTFVAVTVLIQCPCGFVGSNILDYLKTVN